MGGYGFLGYFNARADWNVHIIKSAYTHPSAKQDEKWVQHSCTERISSEL